MVAQRMYIRRCRASDAPAILAIRAHPVTRRFQPMTPGTLDRLEQILAERGSLPLTPSQSSKVQWTIMVDETPVGWISLDITHRKHHIASLGYAVDPHWHGRGLATTAIREVVSIGFDRQSLAIERLEAVAAVGNVASRRVLEKCGFAFEGVARGYLIVSGERVDHARYALLRG